VEADFRAVSGLKPQRLSPAPSLSASWPRLVGRRQLADRLRNVSDADLKKLTGDLRQLKQGLGKAQSIQSGLTVAAEVVHEDAKGLLDATERHGAWPVARMLTPTTGLRTREDMPSPYLRETIEHFTTVLRLYDAQIEALERQLVKHRAAKGSGDAKPAGAIPPHTIAELLRVQQAAFMHVAGSVATIHENVDTLRARVRKRSERDPFAAADRLEKEEERKFSNRMRGLAQPNASMPNAPMGTNSTAPSGAQQASNPFGSVTMGAGGSGK